jgi:hypothetical protein
MLQRIQTIYLLVAAAALGVQFLLPYATVPTGILPGVSPTFADGVFNLSDRLEMLIISGIAFSLVLFAIFSFKNRPFQSRLTSFGMFAAALLAVSLTMQFYSLVQELGASMSIIQYKAGVFMPALSAFMLWLANRAIRKDEALVRSSDRLR